MKKAYFVAVALFHNNTPHASAVILIPDDGKQDTAHNMALGLVHPDYMVLAFSVAELQDSVLIALANLAKEKGLI